MLFFLFRSDKGRTSSSTNFLLVADFGGDEKLFHGHSMHRGEVFHHSLLTVFPLIYAIVLLKVDGELGNHDRVLHVHLHPVQPLDALFAGVSPGHCITDAHRLADVDCPVHEVVVDDLVQHANVVSRQVVDTELFIILAWTVVGGEVVPNIFGASTNEETKIAHFFNTLGAGKAAATNERRRTGFIVLASYFLL